jgi:hypothetical protein
MLSKIVYKHGVVRGKETMNESLRGLSVGGRWSW